MHGTSPSYPGRGARYQDNSLIFSLHIELQRIIRASNMGALEVRAAEKLPIRVAKALTF
jgi:hypothetical protein